MQTLNNALKQKRRRIPISLTPLIDVVFILLVFFMLASSFQKTRSVELIPPKEGKAKTVVSEKHPVNIVVEGADSYKVKDKNYTLEMLNNFLDTNRDQTILIKTGPDAALQDVVSLLDMTGSLSLPKVSLLPFEDKQR